MEDNVQVEVNEQLIEQQSKAFARLMVDNPDTRKRIRKIIREELKEAGKRLREDFKYEMTNDPRKAYRGVKYSVYRKILGGNLSILNPRKAGVRYKLIRDRKLDMNPFQRGGNRRRRSERTEKLDTYYGRDRAFILRFLSSGTARRQTIYGNRGSITARNYFMMFGPKEMDIALENLAAVVNEELAEAFNEGLIK